MDALFLFCCVWSIGALLVQRPETKERDRFDTLMKQLAALGTIDADRVSASQLPSRSLYEYCFDVADGCWRSWRSYVQEYTPPPSGLFSRILVSTADTVRWGHVTQQGRHCGCLRILVCRTDMQRDKCSSGGTTFELWSLSPTQFALQDDLVVEDSSGLRQSLPACWRVWHLQVSHDQ